MWTRTCGPPFATDVWRQAKGEARASARAPDEKHRKVRIVSCVIRKTIYSRSSGLLISSIFFFEKVVRARSTYRSTDSYYRTLPPLTLIPGPCRGMFEVSVPAGTSAGAQLEVILPDGTAVVVTVPTDHLPTLLVEPPSCQLTVTVPSGISAGAVFLVEAYERTFEVVCPQGATEGDDIDIEVPESVANGPGEPAPAEAEAPSSVGKRVKVLRSNGSWTPGTVVEHDQCSDTFTVRLDQGGALKQFVEQSDVADLDFTPAKVGEHYEGRRVQVCVAGAGHDSKLRGESWPVWEGAVVRGFDGSTYSVELDRGGADGGTRCGVRPTDIRVRQRV